MSACLKLSELHPMISDTRDTGNGHYLVVKHFEDADHAEASAIRLDHTDSLKRGGGAARKNDDKPSMTKVALAKSQARSRRAVRHKSLAIKADRMMTLTTRENVTDLEVMWVRFKYFVKLMNHWYGEKFSYIAVPEFQKRGAVHFHLAISGYFNVKIVRKFWKRAVGQYDGNIDITSPKKFGKNSWNPRRIAQYLSKYITKNDSVDFNKKRYSSSRYIPVPDSITAWIPACMGATTYVVCQLIEALCHNPVSTIYESSDGMYPVIFVST